MEHQTRFDVNAAIENWRNELAAQTALSADDRRELEMHLRDAFAGLKSRGLNDEESFVLARHRIGQPQKLADEFVKENPLAIWRERAFWITTGALLMQLWEILSIPIINGAMIHNHLFGSSRHLENIMPQWVAFYLPDWLRQANTTTVFFNLWNTFQFVMGVIFVIYFFAKGKLRSLLNFIFQSRLHFMAWTSSSLVANYLVGRMIWQSLLPKQYGSSPYNDTDLFLTVLLIVFATWLIPAQNRKTPKRA